MVIIAHMETNTETNVNDIVKDSLSLRLVAALYPDVDGEISHQTVSNRRKSEGDESLMTIRWLSDKRCNDENDFLRVNAIRKKRIEYVLEFYTNNGRYPSSKDEIENIRKEFPFKKKG